jgi:hypothetical protein
MDKEKTRRRSVLVFPLENVRLGNHAVFQNHEGSTAQTTADSAHGSFNDGFLATVELGQARSL